MLVTSSSQSTPYLLSRASTHLCQLSQPSPLPWAFLRTPGLPLPTNVSHTTRALCLNQDSHLGLILLPGDPGDIWEHLWLSQLGVLLAWSGWGSEVLISTPQCPGCPSTHDSITSCSAPALHHPWRQVQILSPNTLPVYPSAPATPSHSTLVLLPKTWTDPATTWTDLEDIMLRDISQSQKDTLCAISHRGGP